MVDLCAEMCEIFVFCSSSMPFFLHAANFMEHKHALLKMNADFLKLHLCPIFSLSVLVFNYVTVCQKQFITVICDN